MSHSTVKNIVDGLVAGGTADAAGFAALITATGEDAAYIEERARALREKYHGNRVLVRGLLEVGNRCRNNCLYCGIRADNRAAVRYSLLHEQIVDTALGAYAQGFRTFVIQGGEWPADDEMIESAVADISSRMPDAAITLSLGERPREVYRRWRAAGATRYLLRHETADAAHYSQLHPTSMSLDRRLKCLDALKDEGYQVGAGMMVGSPGQTLQCLCADLYLLQRLRPEMVGMGPFIPHADTPLAAMPAGSVELTARLISIVRIMLPAANIPSTTALATIDPRGREKGLLAGANVVMPNITPQCFSDHYRLYNGKAHTGAESSTGIAELRKRVEAIGMTLDFSRGDYTGLPATQDNKPTQSSTHV